MTRPTNLTPLQAVNRIRSDQNGQVVVVLQGGGALGAYEHGVVRRLFEEPQLDIRYVSGVSIGAISAAILVGARNGDPVATLEVLWEEVLLS